MKHLFLALLLSLPLRGLAQASFPVPVAFISSDLPIVVIDTHQQTILDDPKIVASMGVIYNGPGARNYLADKPTAYQGRIGIELHGSSSQWYSPKKSFSLTTQDSTGANLNVALLGLPADNDWILSAAFSDKTLLRNALTYSIARSAGSYASRTRYCEVVLDGVYQGVYTLLEKIKQGSSRVAISKLKATDNAGDAVTGGYILKLDKTTGSPSASWRSKYQNPADTIENNILYQVDYPKLADITAPQRAYIQAYTDSFETALSTKPFTDARAGYRHFIDTKSFIDYFLLTELSRNVDGYCFSTYFYKDRTSKGGKLTMGPLWDYDLAWGNAGFCAGDSAAGWVYSNTHCDGHKVPFWWRTLLSDTTFSRELRARWASLRGTTLRTDSLDQRLATHAAQLRESQARNYEAWPILGTYVWAEGHAFATYQEEVAYAQQWTHERLAWLDDQLLNHPAVVTSSLVPKALPDASAYPVPFTTALTVEYALPAASAVSVALLNVLGQPVYQQVLATQSVGSHKLTIADCAAFPLGVYSLRLTAGAGSRTLRVVRAAQ